MPALNEGYSETKIQKKRRGVRMNSRVPVAIEWESQVGRSCRGEAHTRVVGPYGCLVVLPHKLELKQEVKVINLATLHSNPAIVVWNGNERTEGWELGMELLNPEMDFWGLEL